MLFPLALALWMASGRACMVSITPQIGMTPFHDLRVTTRIEEPSKWWIATVYIVDEGGEREAHQLFEGDGATHAPRTTTFDWKVDLEAGYYEIQLVTATRYDERCVARVTLEVHQ